MKILRDKRFVLNYYIICGLNHSLRDACIISVKTKGLDSFLARPINFLIIIKKHLSFLINLLYISCWEKNKNYIDSKKYDNESPVRVG